MLGPPPEDLLGISFPKATYGLLICRPPLFPSSLCAEAGIVSSPGSGGGGFFFKAAGDETALSSLTPALFYPRHGILRGLVLLWCSRCRASGFPWYTTASRCFFYTSTRHLLSPRIFFGTVHDDVVTIFLPPLPPFLDPVADGSPAQGTSFFFIAKSLGRHITNQIRLLQSCWSRFGSLFLVQSTPRFFSLVWQGLGCFLMTVTRTSVARGSTGVYLQSGFSPPSPVIWVRHRSVSSLVSLPPGKAPFPPRNRRHEWTGVLETRCRCLVEDGVPLPFSLMTGPCLGAHACLPTRAGPVRFSLLGASSTRSIFFRS